MESLQTRAYLQICFTLDEKRGQKKWKGLDKQTLPSSRLGDCLTEPCVTGDISSHGLLLEEMERDREKQKKKR